MCDFGGLYKVRFSSDQKRKKEKVWQVLCQNYFQCYIKPTDTVLDIACGFGEFLNNIEAQRKFAIDINPESVDHLSSDIKFFLGSAAKLDMFANNSIDFVFASNFFEHLPNKKIMVQVLFEIFRILKPNGSFMTMQPNIKYCANSYWDFFDHHTPLSHLSMIEALELTGFKIDIVHPRFIPFSTKSKIPSHPLLVKLYLKSPLAWKLMGKQFLVLSRKPG